MTNSPSKSLFGKSSLFNWAKFFILLCLIASYAATSNAGVMESFEKSFNGISNSTSPGFYESQKRGIITGGSFYYRQQIVKTNLTNLQLPSIRAGCGGIDFFGGSFSMINAEQFEALLRNVATNAVGYAFNLALGAVCSKCQSLLADLQSLMNEVNSLSANSCALGQNLVNGFKDFEGPGKSLGNLADSVAKSKIVEKTGDVIKGLGVLATGGPGDGGKPAIEAAATPGGAAELRESLYGSVTWKVLKKSNAFDWFVGLSGSSEAVAYDMLQSLVGTIVIRANNNPDEQEIGDPIIGPLTLTQLIEGTKTGERIKYLRCNNQTECDLVIEDETTLLGIRAYVYQALFGSLTDPNSNGGLVGELYKKNQPDTTNQQIIGLIEGSNPGILALLKTQMSNEDTMRQFARRYADVLAYQIALDVVDQLFYLVEQAASSSKNNELAGKVIDLVDKRRDKFKEERLIYNDLKQSFVNEWNAAQIMAQTIKKINTRRLTGVQG